MASSAYAVTMTNLLNGTLTTFSLTAAGNKVALFTSVLAPNYLTNTDFSAAPYTANEVASAGYTAGGLAITGASWVAAGAAPVITYDATDSAWAGVTFTARQAIYYADALAGNNLYYALDFGSDFTATAGPFTIMYNVAGIFTWTL